MTFIKHNDEIQRGKWRVQANRAAAELKKRKFPSRDPEVVKMGFVFDDAIVTLAVAVSVIQEKTEKQLADYLYNLVLNRK